MLQGHVSIFISYLLLLKKITPEFSSLKQHYCLIVFVDQECGCGIGRCLWLRVSHRPGLGCQLGLQSSQSRLDWGRICQVIMSWKTRKNHSKLTPVGVGTSQVLNGFWTGTAVLFHMELSIWTTHNSGQLLP